eukprot:Sspe_Gene.69004::Locus_40668_Transcript_1_1_Confidence_1.000_Length_1321::g.69004::m.69004
MGDKGAGEDASTFHLRMLLSESLLERINSEASDREALEGTLPNKLVDRHGREWLCSQRKLGRGAFGEVFLGMGSEGKLVAIKALQLPTLVSHSSSESLENMGLRRRKQSSSNLCTPDQTRAKIDDLVREVDILKKLHHDSIVNYHASLVVSNHAVVIMEYVAGGSMDTLLTDFGPLPCSIVKRFTRDILSGLECLHRHGIIHRDLKLGNLLLCPNGQCKLADFGAATQLAAGDSGLVGTPLYMAPEAARGQAVPASDVWALGIIVCELFSGRVPYAFTPDEPYNQFAFMYKLSHDPSFAPTIPSSVHSEAHGMVTACLTKDPSARPPAKDLLRDPFVLSLPPITEEHPRLGRSASATVAGILGR